MAVISSGRHVTAYDTRVHVRESVLSLTLSGDMWRGRGEAKLPRPTATRRIFHYALQRAWTITRLTEVVTVLYSSPQQVPRRQPRGHAMTTVVFSIQHAGAPKLEEIVVEVHPEWAPIGAQCVRPATTT